MSPQIQTEEELREALTQKLTELKNDLAADLATLHLYDTGRDRIYFPVGVGLRNEERFKSVPSKKRVVGKIIHEGKSILAEDALHHLDFTGPFTHLEGVKSGAGFPMIDNNNKVLGVVFVNYRQTHEFSDQDIQTVIDWTNQVSGILYTTFNTKEGLRLKTTLRRETDLRRKEYRLLELINQIRETLGDVDVVLWLEKRKEKVLSVSVSAGVDAIFTKDATISIDGEPENFIASAYASEEEKSEENLKGKSQVMFNTNELLPWERALAIPILSENHKLGVLCMLRRDRLDFSPRDLNELHTFARLMAVTIRNEDRIIIQNALHDLGMRVALSLDTDDILNEIVRSAYEILDADIATVHLYDPDKQEYLPLEKAAVYPDPESTRNHMETPRSNGLTANIILNKQRMYIENVDEEKDPATLSTFIREQKIKAYVGLPLISNQQSLGVLYVSFKQPRRFPPDELSLIQLLADNAATAIYNSRLFEESQQRLEQLNLVRQVAADVSSVLDLDKILQRAVDGLAKVFDVKQAAVAIFDEIGEYSAVRAEYLAPGCFSAMGYKIPLKDNPQIEKILATKQPLIVYDVQKDRLMDSVKGMMAERKTLSMMIVPIIIEDEVVGTIGIDAIEKKRRFTEEEANLALAIANQAAVGIHNAQLFQQRETLQDIAHDITSELDRDTLLQKTLERSLEILNCEFGSISVLEPSTNKLQFRYAVGKDEDKSVSMGEGLIGTAAQERKTVRVGDVSKDNRYIEHVGKTQSELDIPLLVGDRLVGVLNAESSRLNAFSEEDQHLAEVLAAQAAVAFHKTELYEDAQANLQERVDDIKALQAIYALIGTASLEDVLKQIAEEAAHLTPAKYTGVWLLDEQAHALRFGAINEASEAPAKEWKFLSLDETSISAHVIQTRKLYRCDDVRNDPYYEEWYKDVLSELTAPLLYGKKIIGTLNLESTEIKAFTEDHERLVDALAGAAAVAIQSARFYQQLERRAEDLAALNEISQILTSGIRLRKEAILELIYDQAQKLTGAEDMYIALYEEETQEINFGLATEHGKRVNYEPRKANMDERGKTEEVIFSRKPILHSTLDKSKAWYGQPGHQEFIGRVQSSFLGVPMITGGKVVGMIALYDWDEEYAYDEQVLQVFSSMASQAAIAIDNATLYYEVNKQLERRVEDLAALNEISQNLTSGIRLREEEILELIYDQTQKLTGAEDMYIALYEEETQEINFGLATEHGKRVNYKPRKANMGERGKTEEVIFSRGSILHSTVDESKTWYGKPGHQEFIGDVSLSWLGVPMVAGDKVVGMIALYDWDEEHAYDKQVLQVFSSMASQAAIAIDNVRLVQQEKKRGDALKLLNEVGEKINATLKLDDVMASIVQGAMRLTGATSGVVHLLKEDELSIEQSFGFPEEFQHPIPRLDQSDSMTRTIIKTGKLLFRQYTEEDPRVHSAIAKEGVISVVGAPLILRGEVIGVLYLNFASQYSFREEDQLWLDTLTEQAAVAIEKARFVDSLEERVRERTRQLAQTNSELKATRKQVVQNTLSAMAGGYVHRLNGALGFIPASLLSIRNEVSPDLQRVVDDIHGGVTEALAYTKRMTNLFTGQDLPRERLNLNLLLRMVVKRTSFPSATTTLLNLDPKVPEIMADKMFLTEVFHNFIINALEAMQGKLGSHLEIGSKAKKEEVEVWFSDTGCGIVKEDVEKLFDPQFTTKPDKHGSKRGIGLWFSKTVIDTLDGSIHVDSTPDKGTTFTIVLPVGEK